MTDTPGYYQSTTRNTLEDAKCLLCQQGKSFDSDLDAAVDTFAALEASDVQDDAYADIYREAEDVLNKIKGY